MTGNRSKWKLPLFSKITKQSVQTYNKNEYLYYFFNDKKIFVHNGKKLINLKIDTLMLGYRLNQFITKKTPGKHMWDKRRSKKKVVNKNFKKNNKKKFEFKKRKNTLDLYKKKKIMKFQKIKKK